MEEAIHLGGKIAVMDDGKLLQYAPPAKIIARPATPFVAELIGTGERPFRLLSLTRVRDLVEPGPAQGDPISADATLRDAYAEMLWSGREMLPVVDGTGAGIGRVRRDDIAHRAEQPQ
jgi:osmoprotectant transport system ATP-binding protein